MIQLFRPKGWPPLMSSFITLVLFITFLFRSDFLVAQEVLYSQQQLDYPSVVNEDFAHIPEASIINRGLDNGTYWLKVLQPGDLQRRVIEFPFARLRNVRIHHSSDRNYGAAKAFYSHFQLPAVESNKYFYIQVDAYRPGYIPIKIRTSKAFEDHQQSRMLRLGLYYGFAISVILFNLLFYLYFRERSFLLYVIFLVVISLNLAVEDGTLNYWNIPWHIADVLDSLWHWLVPVTCAIFTWDYMQFHNYLPKIKWPLAAMLGISGILYFIYHLTGGVLASAWADTTAVLALFIIQLGGLVIFKKTVFARVFVLAYSAILLFAFDLYVPKHFGFSFLGLSSDFLKIGGVIEMVVFSVALVYRMNVLREDNEYYKKEIRSMMEEIRQSTDDLMQSQSPQRPQEASKVDISKEFNLTKRQIEILEGIQRGLSNQEIADELYISLNTVKYHTKNIYEKMGVKRRTQLMQPKPKVIK